MIANHGLTNLGLYRWLVAALRLARMRDDEEHIAYLEDKMRRLWEVLTEEDRREFRGLRTF